MPEGPADADKTDEYLRDFFGVTPAMERRMESRAAAHKAAHDDVEPARPQAAGDEQPGAALPEAEEG